MDRYSNAKEIDVEDAANWPKKNAILFTRCELERSEVGFYKQLF